MATPAPPGDETDVAAALKQQGMRVTSARVALLIGLGELGRATAEQLHVALLPRLPSLSLSTVYRVLDDLADHHLVHHAHLGGTAPSFYLPSEVEHAHLVCIRCGSVDTLTGPALQRFVTDLASSLQFAVNISHLTVEGHCAACQQLTHNIHLATFPSALR